MLTVRREQFRYMKNKYLTRFLCLTLMSGMALSGPASVFAAEDTAAYTAGRSICISGTGHPLRRFLHPDRLYRSYS